MVNKQAQAKTSNTGVVSGGMLVQRNRRVAVLVSLFARRRQRRYTSGGTPIVAVVAATAAVAAIVAGAVSTSDARAPQQLAAHAFLFHSYTGSSISSSISSRSSKTSPIGQTLLGRPWAVSCLARNDADNVSSTLGQSSTDMDSMMARKWSSPPPPPPLQSFHGEAGTAHSQLNLHLDQYAIQPQLRRTRQTFVDGYFRQHLQLPEPNHKHVVLCPPRRDDESDESPQPFGILVVGDVHGCYDELLLLHKKAVSLNQNRPFEHVILVGDLCNKGPHSAAVIRHVRTLSPRWLAVRGNHDNGALREALTMQSSDTTSVVHAKYQWLYDKDTGESTLDDDDIEWLAQLPYTIRIPAAFFDDSSNDNVDNNDASNVLRHHDTLIVHAGLVPGIPLEEQSIDTMVTLRNLVLDQHDVNAVDATSLTLPSTQSFVSWASQWKGPEHVLFGHDAKRGMQQTDNCIGLDTGAVYGKQLTGILLPERRLVQVDSLRTYCPIQD